MKLRLFLVKLFAGKSIAIGQPWLWVEGTIYIDEGMSRLVLKEGHGFTYGFNVRNSPGAPFIETKE